MIAVRVQEVPKAEYEYFNKGNFSLTKVDEPPKTLAGMKHDASVSLFNLNKIFENTLTEPSCFIPAKVFGGSSTLVREKL